MKMLKEEEIKKIKSEDYTDELVFYIFGGAAHKAIELTAEKTTKVTADMRRMDKALENLENYADKSDLTCEDLIPIVQSQGFLLKTLQAKCPQAVECWSYALDYLYRHKKDKLTRDDWQAYEIGRITKVFR